MSRKPTQLARAKDVQRPDPRVKQYQELWFSLSRRPWRSLAIVPVDDGSVAADTAAGLAEVGKKLHDFPVTLFVMSDPLDFASAVQLAGGKESAVSDYASAVQVVAEVAAAEGRRGQAETGEKAIERRGKVIIAVQPVVSEPMGLAVTRAVDLVVVCIALGRTKLARAQRTVELIGRERLAGCLLVNP